MTLDEKNEILEQKYRRDFINGCAETMNKKNFPNNLHFIVVIDLEIYKILTLHMFEYVLIILKLFHV